MRGSGSVCVLRSRERYRLAPSVLSVVTTWLEGVKIDAEKADEVGWTMSPSVAAPRLSNRCAVRGNLYRMSGGESSVTSSTCFK